MPSLVALALPPGPEFVDELRRIWEAGDAVFPVDTRLPAPALRKLLETMGVSTIVDANGHSSRKGTPTEPGDALVMTTSGTTAKPKAAVLTHTAIATSARITNDRLGIEKNDHWLACLPLSHIGGMSVVTRALASNTPLTVLPGFDAEIVETAARRHGATLTSLVPTALQRIEPSLFRRILVGGSALPDPLPPNAIGTYGMTETGSGIVYDRRPLTGVELRTDNGGQLWIRSPTLLRCYRNGHDPKDQEGWFPTGDAGTINASGDVYVFGRMDEVINTGGEKVWPADVEKAIRSHRSVANVRVYGEPDKEWGERVVATIEVSANDHVPTLGEMRVWVKERLPAYAAPRELRVVDHILPASASKRLR